MSLKAAEAKGLLEFVVSLLEADMPRIVDPMEREQAQLWLASGKSALKVQRGIGNTGILEPTFADRQRLFDDYLHHVVLYSRAGGTLSPKHHMMVHMLVDMHLGSPWLHATYRDESYNGVLRGIARSCHRSTFGDSVHTKTAMLQALIGDAHLNMH